MPRKLLLIVPILAVAALAAWAAIRVSRPADEWTTDSPEALAALERALEAERKLYHAEAREHFARAVELDPQFAAAKVGLLRTTPYLPSDTAALAMRKQLLGELAAHDRTRLEPREALLVEYTLALADGKRGAAVELLKAYLEEHPSDPYALELYCEHLWAEQDFAEAERTYERLLAVEPNWVRAQNNLGYLAMAQGQFAAAEDRFLTYRYVAPDQANPHDSLGELMLLTGRWEEARRELEQALAVRRDFCASYTHLTDLALLTGNHEDIPGVLERAEREGDCGPGWTEPQRCRLELWQLVQAEDWARLTDADASCATKLRVWPWISHLAALQRGDLAAAKRVEAEVAGWDQGERRSRDARAMLSHLEGMRLVAQGKPREGVARLRVTDGELSYFGIQLGLFKLYNRLQLSDAYARAGDTSASERLLAEVAAVNPTVAKSFHEGDLARLRLRPAGEGAAPDGDRGAPHDDAAAAPAAPPAGLAVGAE